MKNVLLLTLFLSLVPVFAQADIECSKKEYYKLEANFYTAADNLPNDKINPAIKAIRDFFSVCKPDNCSLEQRTDEDTFGISDTKFYYEVYEEQILECIQYSKLPEKV